MIAPDDSGGSEDDASLSARILKGDRVAENRVVVLYSRQVLAMAMVRIQDHEVARELVDDVMMATVIALRRGTVHDTARLGAFVHGTALNLIHSHQREFRRQPQTESLGVGPTIPDLAESCEKDRDMRGLTICVERLSLQDRLVLLMSVVDGLKPCEIAARLDLSASVVRKQKSRALKRLRLMWDP